MPSVSPFDLRAAAHQAMLDNGFTPDIPEDVLAEANRAMPPAPDQAGEVKDLRDLPWSSIDNDDSRDLDQLEVAEAIVGGDVRIRVAIADVDSTVTKNSAIDRFAATNATSVYAGVVTFPMLPEHLSTDVTSLGQDNDRPSIVIEFVVGSNGTVKSSEVYHAFVRNKAKLAYGKIGAWLEGKGSAPAADDPAMQGQLEAQLRLQDTTAQTLRAARASAGALDFETIEAQPVVKNAQVEVELVPKTRASRLIEDFMIAANVAMARFLDARGVPSIRRVVRIPERWNRIVALAKQYDFTLPEQPDSHVLEAFLTQRRTADPEHFADLSLSVVKLLGPGEYVLHVPGTPDEGHFGLATHDYTHATAPNRRFADLVIQRLLRASLASAQSPYSNDELSEIAKHCTEREDAARKVERQVRKEASAVSMTQHIGQVYDAIVTGVNARGTFVRLKHPPVEGRVVRGEAGIDVGDTVRVTLVGTDPARGFIDFARG